MKVTDIPHTLLQRMRLEEKNLNILAMYFEGSEKETAKYLKNNPLPPVKFVRERLNPGEIVAAVTILGHTKAAQRLGVSKSFMEKQSFLALTDDSLEIGGAEKIWLYLGEGYTPEDAYKLIPYTRFIRHLFYLKGKDARSRFPNSDSENFTSHRGSKGEEFYSLVRNGHILENMNLTDPKHPFDFRDKDYGNVNVKASRAWKYKGKDKGRYWKFSTNGQQEYFGCVCYDHLFESPSYLVMIKADHESIRGKSFTLKQSEIRSGKFVPIWQSC